MSAAAALFTAVAIRPSPTVTSARSRLSAHPARPLSLRRSFLAAPRTFALSARQLEARRAAGMEPPQALSKAGPAEHKALVDSVDCFIFDCDGVIWKGDTLIDGVPETLDMLKDMGKKLIFVTNNSTKSRAGYLGKFLGLGLNIEAEEIYSSSYAAAAYLESIKFDKKVYVVGEVGICEELDLVGIPYIGGPEDKGKVIELTSGFYLEHDKDVGAVIVGFDRHINYHKIQMATLCIRENPGCLFIATNLDAVTHLTDAQEWAGNGSMVGAIKGSTKKEPIVVGKPAEFMLANIAEKFGLRRDQICMVGDRLDTDILFGKDGGLTTTLVLSGVTTEETLLSKENKIHPDFFMDKLPDLLSLKAANGVAASAPSPAAAPGGYSPEQLAFLERKRTGSSDFSAPSAAPASPSKGQYSPEQLAFLERKRTGSSDFSAPKAAPAAAPSKGQYSPEQLAFLERKRTGQ